MWKLETRNPSRDITSSRLLKYFLRSTTSPSLPSNSTIQTIIPRHGTLQPHRNHPRPSNRASSNVTRDNHRTLAEMIWCFVNSSAHSSLVAGYRGLKDMQDGCRCTDPLHSLRYLDRLALNQARLTDAGQSAWNLRVTCPRRPPLRLNHRLPPPLPRAHVEPNVPTATPAPFLPLPSRTRNIYGGGWFWFSGICRCHRRRSLPFATRPPRRYTSSPPSQFLVSPRLAGDDPPLN